MAPLGLCLESHSAASKSHRSSVSRAHSHCGASGGAIGVALFELFSPKYFRVFSEDLLYLAQRLENGRDPRSQFRIFIRKVGPDPRSFAN